MALPTQILVVFAIVGLNSAHVIYNHHRHQPQDDLGDMSNLMQDMFHPGTLMNGLFQIHPIRNPGMLGFQSFGDQGLGDLSSRMFGQGPGYGTEDFMPVTSAPLEKQDGNSQGSDDDFGEQVRDPLVEAGTSQDGLGDQFNDDNKETDPKKQDDTDNSDKDQETGKINSGEKVGDDQKEVGLETDSGPDSNKKESGDDSVSKQRDKDSIIFPDKIDQAKQQIAKHSSYYLNPQPSNGYVSNPSPQIIYATTYVPSGSSTNQAPYVSNSAQSNGQSQPPLSTIQSYPTTNNINVQNPQPQYQTNGNSPTGNVVSNNPTTNPGYTLVTLPSNGANGNRPVYYINNAPVSNPPQNVNYRPPNSGQQYYMVSMNGQNVLVPVNSVQIIPSQPNVNSQTNSIPINQGSYLPSNSQVNYVPINNQNVPSSMPQNNGQVQYIAVQLAPQNNPQNNNQVMYVPANQGNIQTPGQNTAQGSLNYVPLSSQPNNQVHYVPANPQTLVQVGSNPPTNSGQTYLPLNPQNPQTTTQYKLVPINTQNNGQGNLIRVVPATLTSNGNVSLLSFKEKEKLSSKNEKKHKE